MKKLIIFVCMLSMILFLFTSCSTQAVFPKKENSTMTAGNKSEEQITRIIFWHYYNGPQKRALDKLIKKFNSTVGTQKKIVIEAYSQGNISDLNSELIRSVQNLPGSQPTPDLFLAYTDSAKKIDSITPLLNLDQYFSKEELNEYVDSFIEEGRFDEEGGLKIFPIVKASEVMFINRTFWNEFSYVTDCSYDDMKTWEGLAEVAEKYYIYTDSLTPEKNDGRALFARDALANYMLIGSHSLGHPIIDKEKNSYFLDFPTIKTLWENYYIPFVKGHYVLAEKFASDSGRVGDVITYVGSSSAIYYISDYVILKDGKKINIDIDVIPVPKFKDANNMLIQQGAGIAVNQSQDENRNLACVEFLRWLTSTENNIEFAISAAYVPVKKENITPCKITEFADKNSVKIPDKVIKTIRITIDQMKKSSLITVPKIKNGFAIRMAIKDCIEKFSMDNRQSLVSRLKTGEDYDTLVAEFTSEEKFKEFYDFLENTLANISND